MAASNTPLRKAWRHGLRNRLLPQAEDCTGYSLLAHLCFSIKRQLARVESEDYGPQAIPPAYTEYIGRALLGVSDG